jgi:TPP-dependent 2-oxoacid decarboxylase
MACQHHQEWKRGLLADYVLKRLSEQHVDTLFGVPAAYCAPLFDAASAHGIASVVTASDLEAGYAADGYARTKGLGAASVAYGVGALSMINAIAGAYVERSPVVVVNGGPTSANLSNLHQFDILFSHSIGQDATDLTVYKLVTASAARAGKVSEVPAVVDQAISTAANLPVKGRDAFLCSGVWASIGHSVSAALGASFGSSRRPLVICGDGGFHMTAQTLSTMVHYGRNPVIVVIANGIYGYEQFLVDASFFSSLTQPPRPYVVLNQWDFVKFASGLGVQSVQTVNTAAAFDAALAAAKVASTPALIVAQVNPHDLPAELT